MLKYCVVQKRKRLCLDLICFSRLTVILIEFLAFYIIMTGPLIAGSKL